MVASFTNPCLTLIGITNKEVIRIIEEGLNTLSTATTSIKGQFSIFLVADVTSPMSGREVPSNDELFLPTISGDKETVLSLGLLWKAFPTEFVNGKKVAVS
jgi:hypothetical protein